MKIGGNSHIYKSLGSGIIICFPEVTKERIESKKTNNPADNELRQSKLPKIIPLVSC